MNYFLYTLRLAVLQANADKILQISSKYQVLGLMSRCEEFLASAVMVENAASMLQLADIYFATQLRQFVVEFISLHIKEVMESDGFRLLSNNLQREVGELAVHSTASNKCCKRRGNSAEISVWRNMFPCVIV